MRPHAWFRSLLTTAAVCCGTGVSAQGIPVLDAANLAQAINQLQAWEQQWQQMNQQLQQLQQQLRTATRQLDASTGSRGLGTVANDLPAPTVDAGFAQALAGATTHAQAAALAEAQARRIGAATVQRFQQIQTLMAQVNATTDAKGAQEIAARIGAEQAMLAAEQKELVQLQQDLQAQLAVIDRARLQAQRRALSQPLRPAGASH